MAFLGNLPSQRTNAKVFTYSPKSQISWKYVSLGVSLCEHGFLLCSLSLCIMPLLKEKLQSLPLSLLTLNG